ncbi:MAG: YIP1 family protein [Candidatus Micrarchaeota archaeon]
MDYNLWIEVLTKPKEVFAAQKTKGDLMAGVMNLGIAYFVVGLVSAIFLLADPVVAISSLIGTVVIGIILSIIGVGILYLIAMLLGGKGTFTQQYYLMSIFSVPIVVLSLIPIVGILVSLYGLYLLTLALKEVHAFDTMKAVLVWLIPVILMVILAAIFAATIFAALMGAAGTGGTGLPF